MARGQNKKKKKLLIALVVVACVLLLLVGVTVGMGLYMFGGLETNELDASYEELGVNSEKSSEGIENILLMGIDKSEEWQTGTRSDAMIVASVNKETHEVKLISLLRDVSVNIEGVGRANLNEAYQYGGAPLAIKTINQTYGLDIKDYISVNFDQLEDLVDAVGGVEIKINIYEAKYITKETGKSVKAAKVNLDGEQALAYSRFRSADSDANRVDRQKTVLQAILTKLQTMPKSSYPKFLHEFLDMVETSLSYNDLMDLGAVALGDVTLKNYAVPDVEYEKDLIGGHDVDGRWCWVFDMGPAVERLHNIIWPQPEEGDK